MLMNRNFFSAVVVLLVMFCPLFVFSDDAPEKGFKITKDTVLNVGIAINPEFESNITKASEDTVTTTTDSRVNNGETTTKKAKMIDTGLQQMQQAFRVRQVAKTVPVQSQTVDNETEMSR